MSCFSCSWHTSWCAGISCRATSDIIVPSRGWTANRTNSEDGSKLWLTLCPKVALYLRRLLLKILCEPGGWGVNNLLPEKGFYRHVQPNVQLKSKIYFFFKLFLLLYIWIIKILYLRYQGNNWWLIIHLKISDFTPFFEAVPGQSCSWPRALLFGG